MSAAGTPVLLINASPAFVLQCETMARRGSDVDLMLTFPQPVGLRFFSLPDEMAQIPGVPVDLVTRESVEEMTNPFRKESILSNARQIFPC